jgi:hypothetical protein
VKKTYFILGFSLMVLLPGFVFAAGPMGITITPLKYVIEANPGERFQREITVINPNDFVLNVRPEFQDFKVAGENEIQWVPNDVENPYKMTDWIYINKSIISLKPHGEAKLPFTIVVPQKARVGGHYAAVFLTAVTETEGNVGSVPRVGALIILNVAGDIKKTGELVKFSSPLLVGFGPVDFKFTFLNTGTTHYENNGQVVLRNMLGQKTVLASEKKFFYPEIERETVARWDKKYPIGFYLVQASIGDGVGKQFTKTRIMLALPLKIFLPVLALLIILILTWRVFKRKFKIVRTPSV